MGQRITITDNEKKRIKLLYENQQEKNIINKLNTIDLSTCQKVRNDFDKERILSQEKKLQELFLGYISEIKQTKNIDNRNLVQMEDYIFLLLRLMSMLCFFIQIMTTSNESNWNISKSFFTPIYNSLIGIEEYFKIKKDSMGKLQSHIDTFRDMYNSYK